MWAILSGKWRKHRKGATLKIIVSNIFVLSRTVVQEAYKNGLE